MDDETRTQVQRVISLRDWFSKLRGNAEQQLVAKLQRLIDLTEENGVKARIFGPDQLIDKIEQATKDVNGWEEARLNYAQLESQLTTILCEEFGVSTFND